jgi:TIR domain
MRFGGRKVGIMTGSTPTAAGRIFISYRRQDTAYPAGWLYERLAAHFSRDQVFKDVDSIELGEDFAEVITAAVGSCDMLIALIGDQWLTSADEAGGRRLDDPDDFVRLEIEAALTRNVRVIPILVDGASMPRADELPDSLARLVRRQALELSPARFDFDTSRLLKVLDKALRERHALREAGEQARGKTEKQIVEATASIRDAPPIDATESEPSSVEATPKADWGLG